MEKRKKYTLGLITDSMESAYHMDLFQGISDYAGKEDINILFFSAPIFTLSDLSDFSQNPLYHLITAERVDGLMIFSPMIAGKVGEKGVNSILNNYHPIPIVSIVSDLEDFPSVTIDNTTSLRSLISHLIIEHKCKNIACIKGPLDNPDAEERYSVYLQTLKEHGMEIDTNLITQGPFGATTGINSIRTLVEERNVSFDALICPNDDTALGAMEAMKAYKIDVPGQVKVIGFDNIPNGKASVPRLTTIDQPAYSAGRTACKTLVQILKGEKVKKIITLPTKAIIRESCGCRRKQILETLEKRCNDPQGSPEKTAGDIEAAFLENNDFLPDNMAADLLHSFFNQVSSGQNEPILELWKKLLNYGLKHRFEEITFRSVLDSLRLLLTGCFKEPGQVFFIYETIIMMEEQIGNYYTGKQISIRMLQWDAELRLDGFMSNLSSSWDLNVQRKIIYEGLLSLGFTNCSIALFDDSSESFSRSRLLLTIENKQLFSAKDTRKPFRTAKLVPFDSFFPQDKPHIMLVLTLRYGPSWIGFLIVNHLSWSPNIYQNLQDRISAAFRNSMLFQKLKTVSNKMNTLVKSRTEQLWSENTKLKKEVKKLQEILIEEEGVRSDDLPDVHPDKNISEDFRIQKIVHFIEKNYNNDISLSDAAEKAFLGVTYFSKVFKKTVGMGFTAYLTALRLEKAEVLLKNRQFKVTEIAAMVGFRDPNYFCKTFKKHKGATPGEYRKNYLKLDM